jgi:hypothetical protein
MVLKKIFSKNYFVFILFLVISIIELGLQISWLDCFDIYSKPIIYLFLSFWFLFIGYYISTLAPHQFLLKVRFRVNLKIVYFIIFIAAAYTAFIVYFDYQKVLSQFAINPHQSDVIPSIQIYVERFLSGKRVYNPIPMPGYQISPDYITFLWLPYIIPQVLNIDYRLFSLILFYLFILIYSFYLIKKQSANISTILVPALGLIFLYLLVNNVPSVFGRTLELTISVYYMILVLTILNKNRFILVIGILLCLLSRYSLSFWLVSYIIIILVNRGFKEFVIINLYLLIGVLVLFIPFIIHDLNIFIEGLKYYGQATLGEWKVQDWQALEEKPYTISRGYGFAIYFHDFIKGSIERRLNTLKLVHLILSIFSGLSVFVIYKLKKSRIKDAKVFLMFGLKFFLMVFYIFIQIPYDYLFIVPLFLTVAILGELINKKKILILIS